MTAISHGFAAYQPLPSEAAPKATFAATAAAVALALLIGLGAVDIHWDDRPDTDQSASWERDGHQLDGRGKWAGYLQP